MRGGCGKPRLSVPRKPAIIHETHGYGLVVKLEYHLDLVRNLGYL